MSNLMWPYATEGSQQMERRILRDAIGVAEAFRGLYCLIVGPCHGR